MWDTEVTHRSARYVMLAWIGSVWVVGCGEQECGDPDGPVLEISLVAPAWSATAASEDPFVARTGRESNRCPVWQPVVEGSLLEFSTRACDAMTVETPLAQDLPACTALRLDTTHAILTADAPSMGHIGLALGPEVLVHREVPIPGPAAAYADIVVLPNAVSAGTPLRLHVSNHGPNSWRFVALRATLP